MNAGIFAQAGSVALGALLFAIPGFSQAEQPTSGKVGAMEWHLVLPAGRRGPGGFPGGGGGRGGGGFPGGGRGGRGRVDLAACTADSAKICPGVPGGGPMQACLSANVTAVSAACKAELDANPL